MIGDDEKGSGQIVRILTGTNGKMTESLGQ